MWCHQPHLVQYINLTWSCDLIMSVMSAPSPRSFVDGTGPRIESSKKFLLLIFLIGHKLSSVIDLWLWAADTWQWIKALLWAKLATRVAVQGAVPNIHIDVEGAAVPWEPSHVSHVIRSYHLQRTPLMQWHSDVLEQSSLCVIHPGAFISLHSGARLHK